MNRRHALGCALALAISGITPALAGEFVPTRPLELVVHGGPGSGNDLLARAVVAMIDQAKLSPVRIQVVNKPGGGSTNASSYLLSRKGDPNTLGIFTSVWIIDPLLQEAATTRLNDLTPVARLIFEPALVTVRADSPFQSLGDFIAAAKAKPDQLKQSGGNASSRENILRQQLMGATKTSWAFVSFPSGGERLSALLGGHVDIMILDPSEATELIRGGKIRVLAQIGEKRLPAFKDVPTLAEAGFDVATFAQTRGILGPPDMAPDVIAYYDRLVAKLVALPAWQKYIEENHFISAPLSSAETRKFVVDYENQIRDLLTQAGMKVVR
ncbi:tripartite tricarboxylate transporter substrate binding protein [Ancylobacter sp. TS-1]|uniref:Bug family tripartite tricarboxylate transporter substrate binding protein n=1 Tax=Ancylobacter sp. TS-1 TaxID=1850374 RepID=UPI001391FECB|nr:tripartite tricarboxylate transporter substrate binding protein [Ancylobacter sp. TS-1]